MMVIKMNPNNKQIPGRENMTSKVYLDGEEIIHVESIGPQTEKEALLIRENVLELGQNLPGKLKIITDLSKITTTTSGSRKVNAESIKMEEVGKVALFGGSTFNKVVSSFVIKASGMYHKVRCFNTEEEAINWLKEG